MRMHTFVDADSMPRDRMYAQVCRRLQYLREKLIADLENPTKVFVYRDHKRNLTHDQLSALHAALRSYGDTTLLYVRYQDEAHPNGTVEVVKPGLIIGYIDRFVLDRDGNTIGLPTASWLTICRETWRLWPTAQQTTASAA
jgi:hypothetical protein